MQFERRDFLRRLSLITGVSLVPFKLRAQSQNLDPLNEIPRRQLDRDRPLESLCFGSCNRESRSQDFWPTIAEQNPDLFIAAGDNIYADTTKPEVMLRKYLELKNDPYYRDFIAHVPMIGTWDDHDFGWNNAGSSYQMKKQTR